MNSKTSQIHSIISSLGAFTTYFGRIHLRPYQLEAANAVLDSVFNDTGETFVWKFARQGGKDETLAALYQYLMTVFAHRDVSIVAAAPTMLPQSDLSIRRLESRLSSHLALQQEWKRASRYSLRIRKARTLFLSAQSHANVVGATAWPLLVINEAQDILPHVYDKRFAPMAAANNATRLFVGTAWTDDTLLAREERAAAHSRRTRTASAASSSSTVTRSPRSTRPTASSSKARSPASAPITPSSSRSTSAARSTHSPACSMKPAVSPHAVGRTEAAPAAIASASATTGAGRSYAFLIDVAGMNETPIDMEGLGNPGRDSTTLSIVDIDLSSLPTLQAPTYRVVHRLAWIGLNHAEVFGKIKALADVWKPRNIVLDATGVGEGPLGPARQEHFRRAPSRSSSRSRSRARSAGASSPSSRPAASATAPPPTRSTSSTPAASPRSSPAPPRPSAGASPMAPAAPTAPSSTTITSSPIPSSASSTRLEWKLSSPTLIVEPKDPLDDMSHFK